MKDCLNKIKENRNVILTGEIGALLHDIGKLHPNFIKTQSKENIKGLPHHARDIDEFIDSQLIDYFKILKVNIGSEEKTVYDFIRDHHNPKGEFLKLLATCDRKDSADDKGIVRRKQHLEDTWISSPFGYKKEKIDVDCLQKRFNDLQDNLIGLFKIYTSGNLNLTCFRESLLINLKTAFSHALGETRVPANDVTLWDHSYSTASLFKSLLAAKVCGINIDHKKAKWRIFGICWNGHYFINRGKKIGEIQTREKIIKDIKKEIKKKFEDEIPIGNAIYEDLNGIYFTFPDLDNNSGELAKGLVHEALKIVYEKSNNEIWPFFTLSKASSTLIIISKELEFASEKRKIPKMTPTLYIETKKVETFDNPNFSETEEGKDICPICGIRLKDTKKERCEICEDRRKGRLIEWLSNKKETIWIDEVSDKNNRIALISLNFNFDKWLDGTMIGTIFSQSFEDWLNKEEGNLYQILNKIKEKIEEKIQKIETKIKEMEKAKDQARAQEKIKKNTEEKKKLEQKLKDLNFTFEKNKQTAYKILELFYEYKNLNNEKDIAANLLKTFFEEEVGLKGDSLDTHLNNIKERIGVSTLTKETLATFLFTQNPSPARLYRIWKETEEFFELILKEIKNNIYSNKWNRVTFKIKSEDLNLLDLDDETPYLIKMNNLNPQNLLVFYDKNGEFYTIESLEKFKFSNKNGKEVVKETLEQGFSHFAFEDDPDLNLLEENNIVKLVNNSIEAEEYFPVIEINKSPLSLRLIVPALDSIKIIELITNLYNEKFKKVIGKLPLNIKLLVTKRKFPLYILLDAENRMLEGKEFNRQVKMDPWWDIDKISNDKYYGFYPIESIEKKGKYTLDDLSSLSNGKIFSLYPGYFDLELLLGNIGRYSIHYKNGKRAGEDYQLFTRRPYYFYQISKILKLWDLLSDNLSSSQINFIEEILISKFREWRDVKDYNKKTILKEFAEATLRDAFGNKWKELREETRFFLVNSASNRVLIDTIILFRHVIKMGVS